MTRFTSILLAVLVAASATTSVLATPAPVPRHHGGGGGTGDCKECVSSPNNCDITAPCSSFGNKLFCGCRPGYRASWTAATDTSKQWRINTYPGHEHRVWVAPGVVCNELCTNAFGGNPCMEVSALDKCIA
ncbi:hypothetical protein DFH27DRAFT_211002 [Peziza echinospora]|nr:hypothetical protein DFH27DRAFT_211002 [Peziza echinospora]